MIHSICGLQNAGKTELATFLSFLDFMSGRKVLSNIYLSFPHYRINKDFIYYLGLNQPVLRNVTFLLDEAWIWFDCRNAMKSYKNMEQAISTYFFLQSSKDNSNIFLTAQDNTQNEIRIQRNLHRYTECSRVLKVKDKFIPVPVDERDLTKFIDSDNVPLNQKLYIKAVNKKRVLARIGIEYITTSILYLKAEEYFKLYNTYEKRVIV